MTMEELRLLVLESGSSCREAPEILVNLSTRSNHDRGRIRPEPDRGDRLEASSESISRNSPPRTTRGSRLPGELGNLAGILHLRK